MSNTARGAAMTMSDAEIRAFQQELNDEMRARSATAEATRARIKALSGDEYNREKNNMIRQRENYAPSISDAKKYR
jgi:hypothetical protein